MELWAGSGRLTGALREAGFEVLEPFEAYPASGYRTEFDLRRAEVRERLEQMATDGQLSGVHCGITCRTFSQLYRLFGLGTRSAARPEGDGSNRDEALANEDAAWMCKFLGLVSRAGGWFTLENPASSYLWHLDSIKNLQAQVATYRVHVDQCMFGLRSPPDIKPTEVWKKGTVFLPSTPCFKPLARKCENQHLHVPIKGTLKTEGHHVSRSVLAATYPLKLCHAYAKLAPAAGAGAALRQ